MQHMSNYYINQPQPSLQRSWNTRRRRRGNTSPPLVGVELNPGPHPKGRKVAKSDKLDHRHGHKKLTDIQKGEIRYQLRHGLQNAQIARDMKLHETTIAYWRAVWEKDSDTKRAEVRGRKSKTHENEDRYIQLQSKRNRRLTAVDHPS